MLIFLLCVLLAPGGRASYACSNRSSLNLVESEMIITLPLCPNSSFPFRVSGLWSRELDARVRVRVSIEPCPLSDISDW
ncbi:hypothetical protein BU26DRAFT_250148 [Trematosphaeria pertusa]|uniref:Uncharacterized protein n=1 Tax=Trematosphaeria pertusa TaxID=390896 RepID=A0A6A6IQL3_9PLEO|nr:uncharacterized protein BU26DRAFT_250148 [Trematosphaeria pertusa]KAF2252072.1 hypothetical protein BU26DRAFT_250148 [Trematosphaeria pertusa]